MANEQNLRPFTSDQSREEAVKNGRKGGKRSGELKRKRKTLREELLALLAEKYNGGEKSVQDEMSTVLIKSAIEGNTRAFEIIRDTIGEKPTENVTISTPDMTALEEAFKEADSTP